MQGGAPRVVWSVWNVDPRTVSARSVAQRLVQLGRPTHLVWNPVTGHLVQSLPVTTAARGLPGDLNRHGRVCVQIKVLGSAQAPFTDTRLCGLEEILAWLDTWRVPRRWPAGPPLPYPQSLVAERSGRAWARGGHFGISQVPGAQEGDPGAIDIDRLLQAGTAAEDPASLPLPHEEFVSVNGLSEARAGR